MPGGASGPVGIAQGWTSASAGFQGSTGESYDQAEIIAGETAHVNYDAIPGIVYTWPELASVGIAEDEAAERGLEVRVGSFPFMANGRARALGQTRRANAGPGAIPT